MKADRHMTAIDFGVGDGAQETVFHAASYFSFAFLLHATIGHHDGAAQDANLVDMPVGTYKGRGKFSTRGASRKLVGGFCHQHQYVDAALHERHAGMHSCRVLFNYVDGDRAVVHGWNDDGRAGVDVAHNVVAKEDDGDFACLFRGL